MDPLSGSVAHHPSTGHLRSLLARAVSIAPSATAVAHPGGAFDYRELGARVEHIVTLLASVGVGPHTSPEPILVLTEHDPLTTELYWGVLSAGHCIVPASARLPDHALATMAETTGARVGLVAPSFRQRRPHLMDACPTTIWLDTDAVTADRKPPAPPAGRLPSDAAMLCFTSGTTGTPKGVILTQTNLLVNALTAAIVFGVGPGSVQVNPLPLAHFSGASRIILAVMGASTHVTLPEFDPELVLDAIASWSGTHLTLAPSMTAEILDANPERFDLTSLTALVYGTAPMPLPTVEELAARLDCGLINGYGLTESSGVASTLDALAHVKAIETSDTEALISVGKAVPGLEIRLSDPEGSSMTPSHEGEIEVRGAKVSPGYLTSTGEIRSRLSEEGWLRTGDIGRWAHSRELIVVGRSDDMIISGGLNVQPSEVEKEAIRLDGVAACVAFGVPSSRWGQEVRLAVVAKPGCKINSEQLRAVLRKRLDRYKLPKQIHLIDGIPRSPLGKIDRLGLSHRFGQGG